MQASKEAGAEAGEQAGEGAAAEAAGEEVGRAKPDPQTGWQPAAAELLEARRNSDLMKWTWGGVPRRERHVRVPAEADGTGIFPGRRGIGVRMQVHTAPVRLRAGTLPLEDGRHIAAGVTGRARSPITPRPYRFPLPPASHTKQDLTKPSPPATLLVDLQPS